MAEQILSPHGDGVRQLTYRVVPIVPVLFDFEPEMDWEYHFCKHPVLIDGRYVECLVRINGCLKELCKKKTPAKTHPSGRSRYQPVPVQVLGVASRWLDELLFSLKHGQQVKVEKMTERPRVKFGRPILVRGGLSGSALPTRR